MTAPHCSQAAMSRLTVAAKPETPVFAQLTLVGLVPANHIHVRAHPFFRGQGSSAYGVVLLGGVGHRAGSGPASPLPAHPY